MKTDRELLELAAKAAGYNVSFFSARSQRGFACGFTHAKDGGDWNPLDSGTDAFNLMVELELEVSFGDRYFFAEGKMSFCGEYWDSSESCYFKHFVLHGDDPSAATRRVIVLAAAEIGKNMRS